MESERDRRILPVLGPPANVRRLTVSKREDARPGISAVSAFERLGREGRLNRRRGRKRRLIGRHLGGRRNDGDHDLRSRLDGLDKLNLLVSADERLGSKNRQRRREKKRERRRERENGQLIVFLNGKVGHERVRSAGCCPCRAQVIIWPL